MKIGPINVNVEGGLDFSLPPLIPVDQHFNREILDDVEGAVSEQLKKISIDDVKGKEIAITVGSRGIARLVDIIRTTVAGLKEKGGRPFIVPSMGSHGGATAEGQIEVLESYGFTEESTGAPIRSSMEVVEVGKLDDGTPLYIDRIAYEADAIVIANKIKPHADFKGRYESGLVKMLCIGLGKHKGAVTLHHHGFERFHDLLPKAASVLLDKLPILFGLAILENAFDDLMHLEIIKKNDILSREKELLETAKGSIGRLLFDDIDVLIIDEIGKNISGEGMDPNVTGRPGSGLPGFPGPAIQRIVILDVTEHSHGNAVGIGCADFSTRQCVEKVDIGAMYTNAITATTIMPAKLPIIMEGDRKAIAAAIRSCSMVTPDSARIVRIKNTLEVHNIFVSPALSEYVERHENMDRLGPEAAMEFDISGRLLPS